MAYLKLPVLSNAGGSSEQTGMLGVSGDIAKLLRHYFSTSTGISLHAYFFTPSNDRISSTSLEAGPKSVVMP